MHILFELLIVLYVNRYLIIALFIYMLGLEANDRNNHFPENSRSISITFHPTILFKQVYQIITCKSVATIDKWKTTPDKNEDCSLMIDTQSHARLHSLNGMY